MASNNKLIAKNTIVLYARTIFLMFISLYTSRIVLQELGATDFGIYNIVGGVVVLFAFINNAIPTQRFLSYELGKGDSIQLKKVFSISLSLHFGIALLIILFGETIGLWLINTQINIPQDRTDVALIVYHLSVVTCVCGILRAPYTSAVISYEKISFFGVTSLIEGILKLLIAIMLIHFGGDKLILYAILMLLVTLLITFVTKIYCNCKFECTHYKYIKDKELAKRMIGFSSWSLLGSASIVGINQGVSIIFNVFFGVIVNTAIGIANQVNGAVYSFVSNFQTAFIPQIVKNYAAKELSSFFLLINRASRYSFLLLFVIGYPLFVKCDYVLTVWLETVPKYAVAFTQLVILNGVFDALSGPLWSAVQATGKIRNYQIVVSFLFLLSLPLCYIALKLGASASMAFAIKVFLSMLVFVFRVLYLRNKLELNIKIFFKDVIRPAILIVLLAFIGVLIISILSIQNFMSIVIYGLYGCLLVILIGIRKKEKEILKRSLYHKLLRR